MTGYPSIDKPWLKYYTKEILNDTLPNTSLFDYLRDNNKNNLDGIAINYNNTKITYKEFIDNCIRISNCLINLGIKHDDVVTIISSNTPETIYCIYALNIIGAIANLEYITNSEKDIVKSICNNNSKTVIILDSLIEKYNSIINFEEVKSIIVLPLTNDLSMDNEKLVPFKKLYDLSSSTIIKKTNGTGTSKAVIVHSGGTTGVPKGVVLTNNNLLYITWAFKNNGVGFNQNDKYLYFIPPFHAFGMAMGVVCSLCLGMETILAINFSNDEFIKLFIKYRPNHIMCSGAHIPGFLNNEEIQKLDLSFFRTCGLGGTPLTTSQEQELNDFLSKHNSNAKASIGYGMSELSSAVCTELNRYYGKIGSVGIPLPKASVKVIDPDTNNELSYNENGELCFATPGMMKEYSNMPNETDKAIFYQGKTKWLHTGDLGYVDEDGFVFISGRLKRIYSTRAQKGGALFKIFPDYVANVISEIPDITDCAVICVEDEQYKNIAIAFVTSNNLSITREKILSYLGETLPTHSIPKDVIFIKEIPINSVGKIDYQALESLYVYNK